MMFTNTIALVLALAPSTLLAAPTNTIGGSLSQLFARNIPASALAGLADGSCDLSQVTMPTAPTPLPAVGSGLKLAHIGLGRGTQNYTCAGVSSSSAPTQVGAAATLFNATCSSVRLPQVLPTLPQLALNQPIPTSSAADMLLSGHHWFSAEGNPFFNLDAGATAYGTMTAKKNASSDAPADSDKGTNGLGSVSWLKLTGLEMQGQSWGFKEVYRVNTAGGAAPKTCEGQSGSFEVQYSALYYFYN